MFFLNSCRCKCKSDPAAATFWAAVICVCPGSVCMEHRIWSQGNHRRSHKVSTHSCVNIKVYSPSLLWMILDFPALHREIGQKSSEELAREGSGVKAFALFLSELGTLVPESMIPNISVLITHLEGEVLSTCASSSCSHYFINLDFAPE